MAKRKQTKNRKQIKRQTRHFQLRVEHPKDQHVAEVLDYARSQRREVTVIREAVTLYWALENGNLEALFEAFPQYKTQMTPPTTPTNNGGGGDLQEIKAMLEIVVHGRKSNELVMQSALPAPQKPIAAPPVAEIKQSVAISADTIADNFLSMFD